MLTAFAEHTLTAGEKARVADHLAGCSECREVLFLASNADEQRAAAIERPENATWKPRPRWIALMTKTIFVASGLVIVAGIFLRIHVDHQNSSYKGVQVAQVTPQQVTPRQPPAAPKGELSPPTTSAEVAKSDHAPKARPSEADKLPDQSEMATRRAAPLYSPEASAAADLTLAKPVNQPPASVVGGADNSFRLAVPAEKSFADSAERKAQGFTSTKIPKAGMASTRTDAANNKWRTTAEGRLEHFSQGGWAPVLTSNATKFRTVSESPNGLWAGGDHAELFQSKDGGATWNQIALPVPPDQNNDAIVAIHFADPLHGLIETESGAHYRTSDGGQKWQRE
jgi:hypothetical protein